MNPPAKKPGMVLSDTLPRYLENLRAKHARGVATEHSYRPALKDLLEEVAPGIRAVNEPMRDACGAPDYLVSRRDLTLGCIEAKDIGVDFSSTTINSWTVSRWGSATPNGCRTTT